MRNFSNLAYFYPNSQILVIGNMDLGITEFLDGSSNYHKIAIG
jgi:hypothetical protein